MKKFFLLIILLLIVSPIFAYKIEYAEQFYKLCHRHFYMSTDDTMENIIWLEQALKAEFCNPLYALARIKNKQEWKHYKLLFKMHVNLRLVEHYLILANGHDKQVAYFYNKPWKEQNLASSEIAEDMYKIAQFYWTETLTWVRQLYGTPYHLEDIQKWEDEKYRIQVGELDYNDIIQSHLIRLYNVRKTFEEMDENTY